MTKKTILIFLTVIFLLVGCSKESKGKILFVVPDNGFNLPELTIPLEGLKKAGYDIDFANVSGDFSYSLQNTKIKIDLPITEVDSSMYKSISIIGGVGAQQLFGNKDLENLVNDFNNENKIVSSQCLSAIILANAGIIKGKKVTGWNTIGQQINSLEAIYTGEKSTRDYNIVTGEGCGAEGDTYGAVESFTNLYLESLNG